MVTDPKARKIFDLMIERGVIPSVGEFEITENLFKVSHDYYRELFPPTRQRVPKVSEIRLSHKICGLNLKKLLLERQASVITTRTKKNGDKSGYVYVISNPSYPGLYKIGMTTNLYKRLSSYQTYDPHRKFKIENYAFVLDRKQFEKTILETFKLDLVNGEWVSTEKVKQFLIESNLDFVTNTGEVI